MRVALCSCMLISDVSVEMEKKLEYLKTFK